MDRSYYRGVLHKLFGHMYLYTVYIIVLVQGRATATEGANISQEAEHSKGIYIFSK